jgi:hypothetical protein
VIETLLPGEDCEMVTILLDLSSAPFAGVDDESGVSRHRI